METISTFAIIGICIFCIYVIASFIFLGIPPSLSDTYYLWIKKNPKVMWPFRLTLALVGLLLMAPMIALGEESIWQFTGFITPVCLVFTGLADDYRNPITLDKVVHPISAGLCALSAIAWQYFVAERMDFFIGGLGICLIASLITKSTKRAYMLWLELACFISVFACIIKIIYF